MISKEGWRGGLGRWVAKGTRRSWGGRSDKRPGRRPGSDMRLMATLRPENAASRNGRRCARPSLLALARSMPTSRGRTSRGRRLPAWSTRGVCIASTRVSFPIAAKSRSPIRTVWL